MIRIILYGYQIQDGKLVLQPQEAEVVKRIFSIYLKGTYQWKIADILNADGVVYSQERPQWTMHRVGFILKNPRYMGADDYPVIVSSEAFQRAQETIQKWKKTVPRADRPALQYREKPRCGECSGPLKRRFSGHKRNDTLYLQCEGCGFRAEKKILIFWQKWSGR
ncbi:recombinase family protein [Oscillospiraceae bacterium 50-60]